MNKYLVKKTGDSWSVVNTQTGRVVFKAQSLREATRVQREKSAISVILTATGGR